MSDTIAVLIVEDHRLVKDALAAALEETPGITVIGTAASRAETLSGEAHHRADVVLMDYRLPDGDGVTLGRQIMATNPRVRVILVTGSQSDEVFLDALRAGFAGCVSKTDDLEHLATCIDAAHRGMAAWSSDLLQRATRAQQAALMGEGVTRRERAVLSQLATGDTNEVIAERLHISGHTLRNHVQNAMEKLGCHTRLDAVLTARRLGVIEDEG
jgi:two-component system nitrate/nitrite response regulator NarL